MNKRAIVLVTQNMFSNNVNIEAVEVLSGNLFKKWNCSPTEAKKLLDSIKDRYTITYSPVSNADALERVKNA